MKKRFAIGLLICCVWSECIWAVIDTTTFNDTIKISETGNVLEVHTFFTYPSKIKKDSILTRIIKDTFYLTIKPKYKFGDFSFVPSLTDENIDSIEDNSIFEVEKLNFNSWQVRNGDWLIVPDNKPLRNLHVAFRGFTNYYFPYQYLKPLLKTGKLHFKIAEENANEKYDGTMTFSIKEYTSLEIKINGFPIAIPFIKIEQSSKINFKNFARSDIIIYKRYRTYWVLNNINDPIILKNEGYRSKVYENVDDELNEFQYIENHLISSIKTK